MVYWFEPKPKLTSLTLKPPGLWDLLVKRTSIVSLFSTTFHIGMVTALVTGIILEIMYFTHFSVVFQGWGWVITWIHGIVGLIATIGFIGVLQRFSTNKFFRLASGKMFYVDTVFIAIIAVSGIILLLRILGLLTAAAGWMSTVHISAVIVWLIVSLFADGMFAHAVATIVYRFNVKRARSSAAAFQAFNSACSRCGKCVEICPLYEATNERPEEAPALKVRKYLNLLRKGLPPEELKAIVEDVYVCALCGLCVAVCPYSFRHYDLYTSLLAQVNKTVDKKELIHA